MKENQIMPFSVYKFALLIIISIHIIPPGQNAIKITHDDSTAFFPNQCSFVCDWGEVIIGLDDGLVPNRWVII